MALRITAMREAKGWTRSELARRAGMANTTVGLIESGRFRPYPVQIVKLAAALGVAEPGRLLEEVDHADD